MRDLAAAMNLPLLIVARPGLGTISHTELTIQYALAAGLSIVGVVISNYPDEPGLAESTNPEAIEKLTGVPIIGLVKHDPAVDTDNGFPGSIVADMAINPLLDNLLRHLSLLQTAQ